MVSMINYPIDRHLINQTLEAFLLQPEILRASVFVPNPHNQYVIRLEVEAIPSLASERARELIFNWVRDLKNLIDTPASDTLDKGTYNYSVIIQLVIERDEQGRLRKVKFFQGVKYSFMENILF